MKWRLCRLNKCTHTHQLAVKIGVAQDNTDMLLNWPFLAQDSHNTHSAARTNLTGHDWYSDAHYCFLILDCLWCARIQWQVPEDRVWGQCRRYFFFAQAYFTYHRWIKFLLNCQRFVVILSCWLYGRVEQTCFVFFCANHAFMGVHVKTSSSSIVLSI